MKNIFLRQIATILCEELILACVHVTGTADNNSYHTTDVPLPEIISVNAILVLSRDTKNRLSCEIFPYLRANEHGV